jgi:hypothetical protein
MMLLDPPTFVVERRINRPLAEVQRGLADRKALVPNRLLDLDPDGFMYVAESLRPMTPYSSRQPLPTWLGSARLLTSRHRLVARVELEVSIWSHDATSLILRPVARNPARWGSRRLRHYFALAHLGADAAARLLDRRAMTAVDEYQRERVSVPDHAVEAVCSSH